MARPPSIRDEDLFAAVHAVVRERGAAATTAEIAARAQVSEGTLFHRFKTKNQLFIEALLQMPDPAWVDALPAQVGRGDLFEHLVEVGLRVIEHIHAWMPLSMVAASAPESAGFHHRLAHADSPKSRFERKIGAYFEAELRAGRLVAPDSVVVTRTFLGALHSYVFDEFQMRMNEQLPMPPRVFVTGLVAMLQRGVAPTVRKR